MRCSQKSFVTMEFDGKLRSSVFNAYIDEEHVPFEDNLEVRTPEKLRRQNETSKLLKSPPHQ